MTLEQEISFRKLKKLLDAKTSRVGPQMGCNENDVSNVLCTITEYRGALKQANELLSHLMAKIQWGKTFDVDFKLLNETLLLIPNVLGEREEI